MAGPMEECMIEMRGLGFRVCVAERRVPGMNATVTKDLFGFIDLVGIHPYHGIVGVQATTRDNFSARLDKIMHARREEATDWLQAGGKIWCVGWGHLQKPPPPRRNPARQKFGRLSAVVLDDELGLKEIPMSELGGGSWILKERILKKFPITESELSSGIPCNEKGVLSTGTCYHCYAPMYCCSPTCDCEHQYLCPKCGHETHKALFKKPSPSMH